MSVNIWAISHGIHGFLLPISVSSYIMVSRSASLSSVVDKPLSVGTTTLPKEVLSFRWAITDPKVFLEQLGTLKSPVFFTTFGTLEHDYGWYLHFIKESDATVISLWHDKPKKDLNVVISKCMFSILDEERAIYTTPEAPDKKCAIVSETESECVSSDFIKFSEIEEFQRNDALTIQVDAILLSYAKPEEKEPQPLPQYSGVKSLLENELFTDVTIKCGDSRFPAHKAILAAQSPVFKSIFVTNMEEKESNTVNITDISATAMPALLTYIYTGTISKGMTLTLAKELLVVANTYQLYHLLEACETNLKFWMEATNVLELLVLADDNNAPNLKKACLSYVSKHATAIYQSDEWKSFKEKCDGHSSLLVEIMEFKN